MRVNRGNPWSRDQGNYLCTFIAVPVPLSLTHKGGSMKFNLVVEIDPHYIDEFLIDNPDMSLNDLKALLNNACYLGLDCTNAIIERQVGFGPCETYVEKTK